MDDERLLIEAAQKDPHRFDALYERNVDRLYAFVVRRVRDRHEAEDVTAEAFQHALANLSKFEWRGIPFAAWLFRIAANVIADRAKTRARQNVDLIPDSPDASWPTVERFAIVFEFVDRLPADQRSVIIKRFVEEKSIRDIAQELGRSEGAIKQLQYRGLETLRASVGGVDE